MKSLNKVLNKAITLFLIIAMTVLPVCAGGDGASSTAVQPRYNNISSVVLSLEFDMNNVAYCCISADIINIHSRIDDLIVYKCIVDNAIDCVSDRFLSHTNARILPGR